MSAENVLAMREFLREEGAGDIYIIAKIESERGLANAKEILEVFDDLHQEDEDIIIQVIS